MKRSEVHNWTGCGAIPVRSVRDWTELSWTATQCGGGSGNLAQRLRHAPAIRPEHWPTAGRATDRRAPARSAGDPAPAMDGASTVAARDLVDGGGDIPHPSDPQK